MNDLLKEYRKTMDAGVLHLWAADAVAEIARLRAEADALRAGQKLVGYRWRHSAGEKWQYSDIPCGWEYEPLYAAMGADA